MPRSRHRKKVDHTLAARRTSAVVAVTAVSTLAPLALSSSPEAHAADSNIWDKIAACESSGDWSTNTGNGYSGGLQFSPSTWRAFGGSSYAATAANASRTEQIAVATRVQQAQGWGAWPVCSKKAGATGSAPAADRPDDPAPKTVPVPDDSSTETKASPATPDAPRTDDAPTQPLPAAPNSYTVVSGDTLNRIAREHAPNSTAQQLAKNSGISNPDMIMPGDEIRFSSPDSTAPSNATITQSSTDSDDSSDADSGSHHASSDAVGLARTWIGTDYEWGGNTKDGVDCSGLVQRVFADLGTDLPRTSQAQYDAVEHISESEARPGDLVFGGSTSNIHHVGIYLGNGQQIDAPRTGKTVGVHKLYSDQTHFGRVS